MKKFIASMELRWSDLFLLLGFIPFAMFLVFGQELMQHIVPEEIGFPLIAVILCFAASVIFWGIYIYLENKDGHVKFNWITILLIGLILLNVIVICAQPSVIETNVICRTVNSNNQALYPGIKVGDLINVTTPISDFHKIFFSFYITLVIGFIYIGFFIFPKRFKSMNWLKYFSIILFVFMFALIIFSYITEYQNYGPFINALAHGEDVTPYTVKSFIIHRNAYGMAMLMGIIFAYINHAMTKKWYNYLLAAFFFINMIFSWCKTSLILALIITVIYVAFRLIYDFKNNKKRNTILIIVLGAIVVIGAVFAGILLLKSNNSATPSDGPSTIETRRFIWDNCFILISGPLFLVGRGFGIFNTALLRMNDVNGDHVFPSHNSFVNMLTEGGILYLLALLALLVYVGYIICKSYKKNPTLVIALSLGIITFTLYSFIETIHYLAYVFMAPMFIFYEVYKDKPDFKKEEINERKAVN